MKTWEYIISELPSKLCVIWKVCGKEEIRVNGIYATIEEAQQKINEIKGVNKIKYNLEWNLRNIDGEEWKQLLTNLSLEEFEIEYGNNIHTIIWLRLWKVMELQECLKDTFSIKATSGIEEVCSICKGSGTLGAAWNEILCNTCKGVGTTIKKKEE